MDLRDEVARGEDAGLPRSRRASAHVDGGDRSRRRKDHRAARPPLEVGRVSDPIAGRKGGSAAVSVTRSRQRRAAGGPPRRGGRRGRTAARRKARKRRKISRAPSQRYATASFPEPRSAGVSGAGERFAPSWRASLQKSAPWPTRGPRSRNAQAWAASCRSVSSSLAGRQVRRDRDAVRRAVDDLAARQLAAREPHGRGTEAEPRREPVVEELEPRFLVERPEREEKAHADKIRANRNEEEER